MIVEKFRAKITGRDDFCQAEIGEFGFIIGDYVGEGNTPLLIFVSKKTGLINYVRTHNVKIIVSDLVVAWNKDK